MDNQHAIVRYLVGPGPRPPYPRVAFELWGSSDFDSDGDSAAPDDIGWTELTLHKRPDHDERIDIDCVCRTPLVLKVVGTSRGIVERTLEYLQRSAGGEVVSLWPAAMPS